MRSNPRPNGSCNTPKRVSANFVDDAVEKGPQIVVRRGVDTAVVVSIDEWQKSKAGDGRNWKDILLGEGPRFDILIPKRGTGRSRKPPAFD
jgi:antitoxin Phd